MKATSNKALKESMKSLESNLAEKKRRTRNIVISGVPEQDEEDSKDLVFNMIKPLEEKLVQNDVLIVKRMGQNSTKPRLLHVVLKYEIDATTFHNGGAGRKIDDRIWINPDLTRTERDILYQKHVQRRK